MKITKHSRLITAVLFLFLLVSTSSAKVILENQDIIGERAAQKIEMMGLELKQKTGVNAHLAVVESLKGQNIVAYEQALAKELKEPFILLTLSKDDHQVDIIASDGMLQRFDKEGVLSPYPWNGTVIPLLTNKKANDKYSAAMLNGYADIVEQVAGSYGIVLESGIGSANKETMGWIRFIVYGSLAWVIGVVLYRKVRKNYARAS